MAIVGRPNAGKSSLFNRLAGAARAIVTDVPGTTRDLLTERVDVGGVPFTIVDTAGLRARGGRRDRGGRHLARAPGRRRGGPAAWSSLDRSRPLGRRRPRAAGTTRRPAAGDRREQERSAGRRGTRAAAGALAVSSLTDEGIDELRAAMLDERAAAACCAIARRSRTCATSRCSSRRATRWRARARRRRRACRRNSSSPTCTRRAARFDEITGARPQDEVLRVIFERFCIGK